MDKTKIGRIGEDAAARYLMKKGYLICERNYRLRFGELDIIAMSEDGCTVFVEVKTRKNYDFGYASEFVNRKKQQKLRRAAELYAGRDIYMRFDIIEVYYEISDDRIFIKEINHIEDAF